MLVFRANVGVCIQATCVVLSQCSFVLTAIG